MKYSQGTFVVSLEDEHAHLQHVKSTLRQVLEDIDEKIRRYAHEIREQKAYLWENKSGMDHVEKIAVRQSVSQSVMTGEAVQAKSRRIEKLLQIPYFGRLDFKQNHQDFTQPIYIGIHSFYDEKDDVNLIYDWRAPISTMFYDYETGQAQYASPDGVVEGEIFLKRQYRIRQGEMEFMLESDINIHDDVLQKELSASSDDRMKNIVATIQRDQNTIIRNEISEVLIIQGVAGSGKTSIALHRIAFLLYRFKDSISSKDVLIISPNNVFADYISNVLPELGEENIPSIGIEGLAKELLEHKYKFQTFFEQVAKILESNDPAFEKRIAFKASADFVGKLNEYIDFIYEHYFIAKDLRVHGYLVPAWFMQERFAQYKNMPIMGRLQKLVKDVEQNIGIYYHYDITAAERQALKVEIMKMFRIKTLRNLYKDFYQWLEMPELYKLIKNSIYEYGDVFPLIYLKMHWDGIKTFEHVRHLLVDEMQDYSPIQYVVFSILFSCKKTILGDSNQSVNPFGSSTADKISAVFKEADCVMLAKSYRSSFEISRFAQKISPNPDLELIKRHGQEPEVKIFDSSQQEQKHLQNAIRRFKGSGYHSLGIICRTQRLAKELYDVIKAFDLDMTLLVHDSRSFKQGVVILNAYMAKGLEFDHVIIPDATDRNYQRDIDRRMLYVACTRAMHQLSVLATGKLTRFIQ